MSNWHPTQIASVIDYASELWMRRPWKEIEPIPFIARDLAQKRESELYAHFFRELHWICSRCMAEVDAHSTSDFRNDGELRIFAKFLLGISYAEYGLDGITYGSAESKNWHWLRIQDETGWSKNELLELNGCYSKHKLKNPYSPNNSERGT